jgi:hypothetical protein
MNLRAGRLREDLRLFTEKFTLEFCGGRGHPDKGPREDNGTAEQQEINERAPYHSSQRSKRPTHNVQRSTSNWQPLN